MISRILKFIDYLNFVKFAATKTNATKVQWRLASMRIMSCQSWQTLPANAVHTFVCCQKYISFLNNSKWYQSKSDTLLLSECNTRKITRMWSSQQKKNAFYGYVTRPFCIWWNLCSRTEKIPKVFRKPRILF